MQFEKFFTKTLLMKFRALEIFQFHLTFPIILYFHKFLQNKYSFQWRTTRSPLLSGYRTAHRSSYGNGKITIHFHFCCPPAASGALTFLRCKFHIKIPQIINMHAVSTARSKWKRFNELFTKKKLFY